MGMGRAAWAPAFAFAVSPLAVQYAHYGVVDTLLTFWGCPVFSGGSVVLEEASTVGMGDGGPCSGLGDRDQDHRSYMGNLSGLCCLGAVERDTGLVCWFVHSDFWRLLELGLGL